MIRHFLSGISERPVTGRTVLFSLLGFFGAVMVVNAFMIQAAVSTFGGVDTPSSYKAGLAFEKEAEAAAAQRALGWTVDGQFKSDGDRRVLTVHLADGDGDPVNDVTLATLLVHPVDSRRDMPIVAERVGSGIFFGSVSAPGGQWRLDVRVLRDGTEIFRSRNRVILP